MSRIARFFIIFLIHVYQGMIRPFLVGQCKFHPTCSEYAIEAVGKHGVLRGGLLAVRRLLRCHPFKRGGIDLVPDGVHEVERRNLNHAR